MIKKLRWKIVLINMAMVSVVLAVVFVVSNLVTYNRQKNNTLSALVSAIETTTNVFRPESDGPRKGNGVPAFSVYVNTKGEISSFDLENVIISDSTLIDLVERAYNSKEYTGYFEDYQIRFLKVSDKMVTKIAFADASGERQALNAGITYSLLIGGAALVAFFGLSLLLSSLAVKPVMVSWEQQRRFVADASHELKTPLTVILANLDILLSHKGDKIEKQEKWLENTKSEATDMKKLVDELLYLAKSDAGTKKQLTLSEVDLSDTLTGCVLPFESLSFERGVTIDTDLDSGLFAVTDGGSVKQIAAVLLDNACKYSEKSCAVGVSLKKQGNDAVFSVNNKGSVIAPEDLTHIFDRFYRCDKSREREGGGFGLGLAIAKTTADTIGARLLAQSDEKSGTTFTLRLPNAFESEA